MKIATHKLKLSVLLLACLFSGEVVRAGNTWDGGGVDGNWSNTNNWTPDGNPSANATLTFGGTSQLNSHNDFFASGTTINGFVFNAGAGAFVIDGNSLNTGNIINSSTSLQTINLDLILNGSPTVTIGAGGGDVTLGGSISGAGGLVTSGTGNLALTGSNSYAGGTTMFLGQTLTLGNKYALGTGVLTMGGTNIQVSTNLSGQNAVANNIVAKIGVAISGSNSLELSGTYSLNNTGSRSLTNTISSGTLILHDLNLNQDTMTSRTLTLDGTGFTLVKGVIANGNASFANVLGIAGSVTVDLEGANTYSGGTTLGGTATLILGNAGALGSGTMTVSTDATIQASTDLVGANKINNTILATPASNGPTFSGSHSLEIGKFTVNKNGPRTLTNNITTGKVLILDALELNQDAAARTLTIAGTGDTMVTGAVSNGSANANRLTITNTGITTLSGVNTYTGTTAVNAGILDFANTSAKATGSVTAAAAGSIGLGVGGSGFYSSANVDSLFANTLSGFSMATGSGVAIDTTAGNFTYATNQAAARSLTKLGANTLTLSGSNTYSGATVVNAGTLLVNGSVAGSGVTVKNGATLGGSGTVASLVTVKSGGALAPGNSSTIATYKGGLTLETGANFTFDLNADTSASANRGTNYDGVNVTGGTFNLQSGVAFNMVLNEVGSTTDYNSSFWDSNQSWLIFANTNSPVVAALFSLGTVSADSLGNSFGVAGGSFSFSQTGNDVYLVYTAVPEPATWALLAGGLTCVLVMRRRYC